MISKILRAIKDTFSFFIEDTREDFRTLKKIMDGNYKCKYTKEELKQMFNVKEILKTYWPFVVLLLATACVSWFLAAKYYQVACNEIIMANQAVKPLGSAFIPTNLTFPIQ